MDEIIDQKDTAFIFRLSEQEKQILDKCAALSGISKSKYLRLLLMGAAVKLGLLDSDKILAKTNDNLSENYDFDILEHIREIEKILIMRNEVNISQIAYTIKINGESE